MSCAGAKAGGAGAPEAGKAPEAEGVGDNWSKKKLMLAGARSLGFPLAAASMHISFQEQSMAGRMKRKERAW